MSQLRIYRVLLQGCLNTRIPTRCFSRQTNEGARIGLLMQFDYTICAKRTFSSMGSDVCDKPLVDKLAHNFIDIQEKSHILKHETAVIEREDQQALNRFFKPGNDCMYFDKEKINDLLVKNSCLDEVLKYQQMYTLSDKSYPDRLFWNKFFSVLKSRLTSDKNTFAASQFLHALQWFSEIMEYMKSREDTEVLLIYSLIANCIGEYYKRRKLVCPSHHQDIIRECHWRIQNISDTVCAPILSNLISGLLVTDDVSHIYKLLPQYFLTNFSPKALLEIIKFLLQQENVNGEYIHALMTVLGNADLLSEANSTIRGQLFSVVDVDFVQAYVQACDSSAEDVGRGFDSTSNTLTVGNLLGFMRHYNIVPCQDMIQYIKHHFERKMKGNWKGTTVEILNRHSRPIASDTRVCGTICGECFEILPKDSVTSEEVKFLQKYIYEEVLLGNDSFRNCNPEELNKVISTVKREGPFDLVIDGVNVFIAFNKQKWLANRMLNLINCHFTGRILIIAKSHIIRGYGRHFGTGNIVLLPFKDTTSDDLCYIYAALLSGPDTYLLSNDLFRNHFQTLSNKKVKALFLKWQNSRQVMFKTPSKQGCWLPYLFMPDAVDKHSTMSRNNLHVPFYFQTGSHNLFMNPSHILCLKKMPQIESQHEDDQEVKL